MIETSAGALHARCSDCVQDLAAAVRLSRKSGDLSAGKRAHARILDSGHRLDRYLANLLVQMYGACGDVASARAVFDSIPQPNAFSWTLLLAAYAHSGHVDSAREVFDAMPERCAVSWNTIIDAYVKHGKNFEAFEVFREMPEPDVVSWTTLLLPSTVSGDLSYANSLFNKMPCWSLQSFNVMLGAYIKVGNVAAAENLLHHMPEKDVFSWNYLMAGYAERRHFGNVIRVFEEMPLHDIASWTTLIAASFHHGVADPELDLGAKLFNRMPEWNIVVWNTVISGNAQRGLAADAKGLFDSSLERDIFSYNSLLAAYSQLPDPGAARELFDSMPEHDIVSWNTMIAACSKRDCHLDEARSIFDRMPARDIVSWNSIIAAYARNSRGDEALKLFAAVDFPDLRNEATLASALEACAAMTDVSSGATIHAQIATSGFSSSTLLANATIHLYGRCGCLDRAAAVFRRMWRRNEVSWSCMASAMDENGHPAAAAALLPLMSVDGAAANEITFTAILTACAHVGTIEAAVQCFVSLQQDYGMEPRMEHYACLVDLLGRLGWLPEAEELILAMPYEPDPTAVASLLAACRLHGDGPCRHRAVRRHRGSVAESGPLMLGLRGF